MRARIVLHGAEGMSNSVRRVIGMDQAAEGELCVLAAGAASPLAREILEAAGASVPASPESSGLAAGQPEGRRVTLACGHDARGLVYALLELADRVRHSVNPVASLEVPKPVIERPANEVRSLARLFTSDVEDKPWFNDREMWGQYLTMLATQRFNRFNLSLGIGYDFLRNVTDGYFLFAYPFLLPVPGYDVRASGVTDSERDSNLETLQFISEQTVARGLEFQLGLWMHGYEWIDSPNPNHRIEGLSPENHGPYCRDALTALLKACPLISGVTFRVHGESGVPEESYAFWKTVFDGVVRCGREVRIDMHAKGMDQRQIDVALDTGMPVTITPKYWAEHMGMPYHQADIRKLEVPRARPGAHALMALSAGSRSFLRYGYGDLMREDRRFKVVHRIWPGTQRLLIWGDPVTATAHSRAFGFCGSAGVEIFEPLSFKGRRGSGIAGGRCAYADESLKPRWDWEKYLFSHRVWGRLLYNPDSEPDTWRRYLRDRFKPAAAALEEALGAASRILPIVTTAHGASAGNNSYWPEVYTNQPIVDPERKHPYGDSPSPKVFGNVSPLDPQIFSSINEFAQELLDGKRSGKYTPVEVAQWLEDLAERAAKSLAEAEAAAQEKDSPEYRRLAIDIALQIGLGRFFAGKLRSGVLYGIHERSRDREALEASLKAYRAARETWAHLANQAKDVYVPDITVGERPHLRGHWMDRLPAIDGDIEDMAKRLQAVEAGGTRPARAAAAVTEALGRPERPAVACEHVPAERFRAGEPLEIGLTVPAGSGVTSVRLHFRRVNQAERFQSSDMRGRGNGFQGVIPREYTRSDYPLQYYFELRSAPDSAWLHPGFNATQTNQPYFVVRRA